MEILEVFAKVAGQPMAFLALLYAYDRFIARKRNGLPIKGLSEAVAKEVLHGVDMAMTEGFDQLRRDLSTTIARETDQGAKGMENAITKLLLQSELRGRRDRR